MYYCEICGDPIRDKLYIIEIEGTKLKVCKSCSSYGKILEIIDLKKTISKEERKPIVEEIIEFVPNFNELIKKAREEKGLTQSDLAKLLHTDINTISKIESGDYYPSEKLAKKIEKLLGIKIMEKKKVALSQEKAKEELYSLGDIVELD